MPSSGTGHRINASSRQGAAGPAAGSANGTRSWMSFPLRAASRDVGPSYRMMRPRPARAAELPFRDIVCPVKTCLVEVPARSVSVTLAWYRPG
jgi:hypothetical protein